MLSKGQGLNIPKKTSHLKDKHWEEGTDTKLSRTYNHGMNQGLHSLSMMTSGDTFISADLDNISIQNIERSDSDVFRVC
jgi:hypothetical protein